MIVTLAGHVDHGKTSLVQALTGIDTDTLAEEKRRGLTIDIGFAYADIGGRRIGFVDVPGHHRFIHNMVAGVAAHQHALLVVAADDGPMPQTAEHLQILRLLGVDRGVAAITKIDRVEPDRVEAVRDATAALARRCGMSLTDTIPTSVVANVGTDALRAQIVAASAVTDRVADGAAFRLAIDRVFVIKGIGTVVTGTVHSGVLEPGDELVLAPSGLRTRARSLRVSNEPATRAIAGDRCAVNVVGVATEHVRRGDWLVAPTTLASSCNVVVDLTILEDFPRPLRHWLPVHAYHATSHAEGHVALLDSNRPAPGQSAMVELVLQSPLHAKHGDRLILRDHARERTIGGGSVIDIAAPLKGRREPARLARLAAQRQSDACTALRTALEVGDVDVDAFRRTRNLTEAHMRATLDAVDPVTVVRRDRTFALAKARWVSALDALETQIAAYHKTAPHSAGLKADQIRRIGVVPPPWLDDLLAALIERGRIRETNGHFHATDHRPALPPDDAALLRRVEAILDRDAQPPSIGDMAKSLGIGLRQLDAFVTSMTKLGLLYRVGEHRALLRRHVDRLAEIVQTLARARPDGFTAREFRDAAAIGRNLSIDVLEHFDRRGFTRRHGDVRRVVGDVSVLTRS